MPGLLVPGSMAERLTLEDLKAERQFLKKKTHVKGVEKMIRNLCAPKKLLKKECSTFFLHFFFWGGWFLRGVFQQEIIPQKKGRGTQDD